MSSFFMIGHLIPIVLWIHITVAQDTICVWNAQNEWSQLNGEYVLQSDRYNDRYYWTQNNTECDDQPHTISATQYGFLYYWTISPTDTTDARVCEIEDIPICSDYGVPYKLPYNPTLCTIGYHVNQQQLSLTLSSGTCPSLDCDTIYITNTLAACNGIYTKDNTQNNIYKSDENTYLYFNPYNFKWHCSHTISSNPCNDSQGIISSRYHEWNDFLDSFSFTLQMIHSNGDIFDAQFLCLDTIHPTEEPTTEDTPSPSAILPIKSYKAPKMPRLMTFLDWYIIAGILFTMFCILSVLRWSIRGWRRREKRKKASKPRATSIIITPPEQTKPSRAKKAKVKKTMTLTKVQESSESTNPSKYKMSNTLNTVVRYGTYNETYTDETFKLNNLLTKKGTIEMQNNQLYIVPDRTDEDDDDEDTLDDTMRIGSPTLLSVTENRALQTPSMTGTVFGGHHSATRTSKRRTNDQEDTMMTRATMSSLDDIYGKYDPSDRQQGTFSIRTDRAFFQ